MIVEVISSCDIYTIKFIHTPPLHVLHCIKQTSGKVGNKRAEIEANLVKLRHRNSLSKTRKIC